MESNKYNIENFERFLRDKTDEFRMYPSKKVWYSVYNNMHPGNRLPSVSMSIILIGFLFLIGYLHTDVSKHTSPASSINTSSANTQSAIADNKKVAANSSLIAIVKTAPASAQLNTNAVVNTVGDNRNSSANKIKTIHVANTLQRISTMVNNAAIETAAIDDKILLLENKTSATLQPGSSEVSSESNNLNVTTTHYTVALNSKETNNDISTVTSVSPQSVSKENITITKEDTKAKKSNTVSPAKSSKDQATGLSQSNKAWMEDFAMHNRPVAKKWAGKLSLQAYITPSVVYRNLHNNVPDKVLASPSLGGTDLENAIIHKASFGVETGLSLQYDIAKKIKVKAGVQFNYTRYNAHAYNTDHPTGTSITMNSADNIVAYESFRTSYYSNAFGLSAAKLHNETYQLSLPIGADIKLAGVDNVAWYAGATIQPTIVLYSNSYIISTDRRSYVQDPSLLNRFNLNAGFETYISYKSANGYTWQVGPQYRKQIFSTNTKLYSVEERLQNFGFKIGVTKRL